MAQQWRRIQRLARNRLGHKQLRPGQYEAIERVLESRDTCHHADPLRQGGSGTQAIDIVTEQGLLEPV